MKYFIVFFFIFMIGTGWLSQNGCTQRPKEIPLEIYVKIWFQIQDDDTFRKKYKSPADAPTVELDRYTRPFGYDGSDFKYTKEEIDKSELKKKQFNDLSVQIVTEMAVQTLNELKEKDTLKTDTANTQLKK
jgi:hypothetical protein